MRKAFAALALTFSLLAFAAASDALGQDAAMGEQPVKGLVTSKRYELKFAKAAELAPIVEAALRNADESSFAECQVHGQNSLLASFPRRVTPLADALIKALDVPRGVAPEAPETEEARLKDSELSSYKPRYISAYSAAKTIAAANPSEAVSLDVATGTVRWKRDKALDASVEKLMSELDAPQTQLRTMFKIYHVSARGVQTLATNALAKRQTGRAAAEEAIMKTLDARNGVSLLSSSECAIAQGLRASETTLDAGRSGKFKITVAYPVVEEKSGGELSVYSDFVFVFPGDSRSARWTLRAGKEKPIAAFALKPQPSFLDIAGLPAALNSKEKAFVVPDDMLVITGNVMAAPQD